MNDEEKNNSGFWLGLIIGGVIGAVAGYLLNSKDKRQALEEIRKKGKLLLENLGTFKDEVVEKGGEVKKIVVEKAEDTAVMAKEAIEKVEKAAQEAVKNISDSVKESSIVTIINPRKKGFGKIFFKKGEALVKK